MNSRQVIRMAQTPMGQQLDVTSEALKSMRRKRMMDRGIPVGRESDEEARRKALTLGQGGDR